MHTIIYAHYYICTHNLQSPGSASEEGILGLSRATQLASHVPRVSTRVCVTHRIRVNVSMRCHVMCNGMYTEIAGDLTTERIN